MILLLHSLALSISFNGNSIDKNSTLVVCRSHAYRQPALVSISVYRGIPYACEFSSVWSMDEMNAIQILIKFTKFIIHFLVFGTDELSQLNNFFLEMQSHEQMSCSVHVYA